MDEMTIQELQYSSIAPFRLKSNLRKIMRDVSPAEAAPLSSLMSRPRHLYTNYYQNLCNAPGDAFLVPGGRFLITQFSGLLEVYDLGIPVRQEEPRVLAETRAPLSMLLESGLSSVVRIGETRLRAVIDCECYNWVMEFPVCVFCFRLL